MFLKSHQAKKDKSEKEHESWLGRKTRLGMSEVLRAELFDRKPFANLFPGRVGSSSLMKYTPGEFPAETFSKARSGCTAVGWTWELLESESASRQEKVVEPVSLLKHLLPLSIELDHCDLAAVHTDIISTCYGSSHHPSVSVLPSVNYEHGDRATINCYSTFNSSSASHDSII